MSLKKKAYFRKSEYGRKGSTRLVRTETDEHGKEKYTQFNIPTRVLHEADPIDLWTHEYSEDTVMDVLEKDEIDQGKLKRHSEKAGELFEHGATGAHVAVSHHTDSSLSYPDGSSIDLTPKQFEEFFWDTGKLKNIYPKIDIFKARWEEAKGRMMAVKTNEERSLMIEKIKKIRRDAIGNVPSSHLDYMDRVIKILERK